MALVAHRRDAGENEAAVRHVLVVEADDAMAELERSVLARAGVEVTRVASAAEAIAALRERTFTALLVDSRLADGEPWAVVEASSRHVPRVPAVLIAAAGNEGLAVEALRRGVVDYVRKVDGFWQDLPRVIERVTRLSSTEDQLRREQARLAEAQRIAQIGSWEWDVVANVVSWSDELFRIFGRDRATFGASYEAFLECVHPEDRDAVNSVIYGAYETHGAFRNVYRVGQSTDVRYVEGRGTVTVSGAGRVLRMAGTAQDVTERMHAEAERNALNGRLQNLNESLSLTLKEREVLLQEVHHRVKNNLQVICSLISLQLRKLEPGENRDALSECRTRVQAIALIHEKLYQSRDYARVPFGDYVRSLGSDIFDAGRVLRENVRLDIEVDDVRLTVEQAIPCGLVLNELMTNALKHGFKDGRAGAILVALSKSGDGVVTLEVHNDGIALPHDFEGARKSSLGLQLVTTLASQLGARLSVRREPSTSFQLSFASRA